MTASKSWYAISNKASNSADVEIYDEIGSCGISAKNFSDAIKGLEGKHLNLRINSPGGSVTDGQAIIAVLGRHAAGYTAHIDGLAASMASVIACSAKETKMAEGSLMMIHNTSTCEWGDSGAMRKSADLLDKTDNIVASVYAEKTGKSIEDIKAMMDEETWMDASECLADGFIDAITPRGTVTAKASEDEIKANFDKRVNGMSANTTLENPVITTPESNAGEKTLVDLSVSIEAIKAERDSAVKDVEALKKEKTSNLAEISTLKGQIVEKDASFKNLQDLYDKSKTALGINGASVLPPIANTGEELSLLDKYNGMKAGPERTAFFQANQKALFEAAKNARESATK